MIKKIIHLSDLHVGTEHPGVIEILVNDINNEKPDIIVISGDSTQRAKVIQFKAMVSFLNSLQTKNILCVPGNHDISLYNPIERFFYPFAKYNKWLGSQTKGSLVDEYFAMLGVNSVTSFKPMGGYINHKQLEIIRRFFEKQAKNKIKIIVMHHNLIHSERHKIINNSDKIINLFSSLNINLVLSGHIHSPHCELLKHKSQHNLYVITAGTPISYRTILANSYNILEFYPGEFKWVIKEFKQHIFSCTYQKIFKL